MRTIKNYSGWMAEEIAKTYLLETGLLDISVPSDRRFDFVAMTKKNFDTVIAIEVKASKYKKSEIIREYKTKRESFAKKKFPVIMFYINYIDKTGLIEVINGKLTDNLIPLTTDNLINEIKKITTPNKR
jgi:hypothetical protein